VLNWTALHLLKWVLSYNVCCRRYCILHTDDSDLGIKLDVVFDTKWSVNLAVPVINWLSNFTYFLFIFKLWFTSQTPYNSEAGLASHCNPAVLRTKVVCISVINPDRPWQCIANKKLQYNHTLNCKWIKGKYFILHFNNLWNNCKEMQSYGKSLSKTVCTVTLT